MIKRQFYQAYSMINDTNKNFFASLFKPMQFWVNRKVKKGDKIIILPFSLNFYNEVEGIFVYNKDEEGFFAIEKEYNKKEEGLLKDFYFKFVRESLDIKNTQKFSDTIIKRNTMGVMPLTTATKKSENFVYPFFIELTDFLTEQEIKKRNFPENIVEVDFPSNRVNRFIDKYNISDVRLLFLLYLLPNLIVL